MVQIWDIQPPQLLLPRSSKTRAKHDSQRRHKEIHNNEKKIIKSSPHPPIFFFNFQSSSCSQKPEGSKVSVWAGGKKKVNGKQSVQQINKIDTWGLPWSRRSMTVCYWYCSRGERNNRWRFATIFAHKKSTREDSGVLPSQYLHN